MHLYIIRVHDALRVDDALRVAVSGLGPGPGFGFES